MAVAEKQISFSILILCLYLHAFTYARRSSSVCQRGTRIALGDAFERGARDEKRSDNVCSGRIDGDDTMSRRHRYENLCACIHDVSKRASWRTCAKGVAPERRRGDTQNVDIEEKKRSDVKISGRAENSGDNGHLVHTICLSAGATNRPKWPPTKRRLDEIHQREINFWLSHCQ